MKKFIFLPILILLLVSMISCTKTPEINDDTMLDGQLIFDASLYDSASYLASVYLNNPTEEQKNTPVIIAAHGYSASTFEWDELRTFADTTGGFYVSQILLGGHGRTYDDFKNSSWKDWQQSIIEEYTKLSDMGFKKISLAGSSTGCPLILKLLAEGKLQNLTQPDEIFLIDPIIVSSNKLLTLSGVVGPILGYLSVTLDSEEEGHWYVYRPQETLQELMNLIDDVRKDLQNGLVLPEGTQLKTYKSIYDDNADPVSAVLIYKGIKTHEGAKTDVEMIDSHLHVYTRLHGRAIYDEKDITNQIQTFQDMKSRVME